MKLTATVIITCSMLFSLNTFGQQILVSEDFESGVLNPMISVQTVGSFTSAPGIKSNTDFGSTMAFGFGISPCTGSCYHDYTTSLIITFPSPTYVDSIKWSEMELFGNYGSYGYVSYDSVSIDSPLIGILPQNGGIADTAPRQVAVGINQIVDTVTLYVYDIANGSEITIDDFVITGNANNINHVAVKNPIHVFPNPSEGTFVLSFDETVHNGRIEISNAFGQKVFDELVVNNSNREVRLENLSPQLYFIKLYNGDGYYCRKILVQ